MSTRDSLEALYDRLSPGGLVYIDDYGAYTGAGGRGSLGSLELVLCCWGGWSICMCWAGEAGGCIGAGGVRNEGLVESFVGT